MWYNLNINKLTELLTPTFLRKERMLAWLRVIHFPLIKIVDDLISTEIKTYTTSLTMGRCAT